MNAHIMPTKAASSPAAQQPTPGCATGASNDAGRPQGRAEILTAARRWYETELERCTRAHGARWPEHREWVDDYLGEELRLRLLARGWGPAHVV